MRVRRFLSQCAAPLVVSSIVASVKGQLHFASLGNWGSGTDIQISVGKTLKEKAKKERIAFVVSPGSNFISNGVTSLEDKSWVSSFKIPYQGPELYLPFFTVLGLDDWQGNHSALALKSSEEYARPPMDEKAPKWTLPNWWYHYGLHFRDTSDSNPVSSSSDVSLALVFIDTYILSDRFAFSNITKLHWDNLRETISAVVQVFDWVVVVGDLSLISSGRSNGNIPLRRTLGTFLKEHKVDAYISGNDNDMEILKDGDLVHINCGSGSKGESKSGTVQESVYYDNSIGFCHHTVTNRQLVTELIDGKTGSVLFTYQQERIQRVRSWLSRFQIYKGLPDVTFIPVPSLGDIGGMTGAGGRRVRRPKETDPFIQTFGTLGLLVMLYVVLFGAAGAATKFLKSL